MSRELVLFYRLAHFQQFVSGQRVVLYTLFGYAIARGGEVRLLMVNTTMIAFLFMFFGAYDNYLDWYLMGERNGTSVVIERRGLSPLAGLLLIAVPWVAIAPLMSLSVRWGASHMSIFVFWSMTALGLSYVTPGIRLKDRSCSFFIAPVWACLLFIQAYTLSDHFHLGFSLLGLCGVVFVLQCHAELLHRLNDCLAPSAPAGEPLAQHLLSRLRWLQQFSCLASLLVVGFNPLFLNTSLWSVVRLAALRRVDIHQVAKLRLQLWHPIWSLYEFAIYAGFGPFRWFA